MSIQNIANRLYPKTIKIKAQETVRDKILLVEKRIRVSDSRIENIETANTANELKMILQLFN